MTTAAELPSRAGLDRRAQKWPLLEYAAIERRNNDRFIAFRGSMDFELAHYLVTQKEKENSAIDSPFKETYRRMLALTLLDNRDRILTFKHKAPPAKAFQNIAKDGASSKSRKPGRYIPRSPERILDAPQLLDDYYLNLLDWSATNVVSVALDDSVYMWHAAQGTVEELVTVEDIGPVTSINWAPDGRHIAVGLNNSTVQLWDSSSCRKIRTLRGHDARVGVLAWNDHILTTGGRDGLILNHDVRIRGSIVQTHRGHAQEVCGLKWSLSGKQLASGGNDNVLHIWDTRRSSQYLHRLEEHKAAVKALAWCPFQSNLLASGGGFADRCIKFWNTDTGACLNSIDTHSQVCSLLWSKHERELLSSHGFSQNQLTLWKYSSMAKIAEFTGHTSRVLHLAQSPEGYTVVSAAADETLRFWKAFGASDAPKKTKGKEELLFKKFVTHIR